MKYTKEFLEEIVNKCKCVWDVVEMSGMSKQEGNYRYISQYIKKYEISTTHFENQRKGFSRQEKPLDDYLVDNKHLTLSGNKLKKKLFKANLLKNECCMCGQGEIWNCKKMSLILDHINGDRKNNKIENLRIVCPNCNATLDTHCGKNRK
jgi:predicted RNA-binding Zn-ribbon protein involved in translation (DUF1610 family)